MKLLLPPIWKILLAVISAVGKLLCNEEGAEHASALQSFGSVPSVIIVKAKQVRERERERPYADSLNATCICFRELVISNGTFVVPRVFSAPKRA